MAARWPRLIARSVQKGAIAVALVTSIASCAAFATKGTMPPPGSDGLVDPSSAPDFIAVAGRDGGIAGYARKEAILEPPDGPVDVYGDDLRTLVGQLIPGVGFVPAGVDPALVPVIPASEAPASGQPGVAVDGRVALFVQNGGMTDAWFTVLVAGTPTDSVAFSRGSPGVSCPRLPLGSRLVLLDRPVDEPGWHVLEDVDVSPEGLAPQNVWVRITADGSIEQGDGVPAWWVGQACAG